MAHGRFGTAINCMDGRVQSPVSDWMKSACQLDYVDMITEAGPDKILATGQTQGLESIKARVLISVNVHQSTVIAIAGHYDCAGNPVSKEAHCAQVHHATQVIRSWNLPVNKVIGLWISDNWRVEIVDSSEK